MRRFRTWIAGTIVALLIVPSSPVLAASSALTVAVILPGPLWQVSVSSSGDQDNGWARSAAVSDDGRYVAFESLGSNLVEGDTNAAWDVFRWDRITGNTVRVSVASDGTQGNGWSTQPLLSGDGRYVVFSSGSTNLVPNDPNGAVGDVFLRDIEAGTTTRLSGIEGGYASAVSSDARYVAFLTPRPMLFPGFGTFPAYQAVRLDLLTGRVDDVSRGYDGQWGGAAGVAMSRNGRYVAFASNGSNLSRSVTSRASTHVYVRDMQTDTLILASKTTSGEPAKDSGPLGFSVSEHPSVSNDGKVFFESRNDNIPPLGPTYSYSPQVYLHDLATGTTSLVSRTPSGTRPESGSYTPRVTPDGRIVAFQSGARDLLPGSQLATNIFVRDLTTDVLNLVNLTSSGVRPNARSDAPAISADGRYVAWETLASNYLPGRTNTDFRSQVYLRDVSPIIGPQNTPPTVSLAGATSLVEGAAFNGSGSFVDADAGQTWSATVDYGDGAGPAALLLNPDRTFSLSHLYGVGSFRLRVAVTDSTGGVGTQVLNVSVANQAPVVDAGGPADLPFGRPLLRTGTFTDPGSAAETYTATVDYGEGGGPTALALTAGTFALDHKYVIAGTYSVAVRVTDSNGGVGTGALPVTVRPRPVIFVPGIMGSELVATIAQSNVPIPDGHGGTGTFSVSAGDVVWLSQDQKDKLRFDFNDDFFDVLKLKNDSTAYVQGIQSDGQLVDSYGNVPSFFVANGYRMGREFFSYPYDFRQSASSQVAGFDAKVREALAASGSLSLDIVAHSQGGLVTRTFLENGAMRGAVAHAVLLGTPQMGTPLLSKALTVGICLPRWDNLQILCGLIATSEVHDLAVSMPAIPELAVSDGYYDVFSGRDQQHPHPYVDDRGKSRRDDYAALKARETEAAVPVANIEAGDVFHATDRTWAAPASAQLAFVGGTGKCTLGQAREYKGLDLFGGSFPLPSVVTKLGLSYIDGDGSVIRQSATLQDGTSDLYSGQAVRVVRNLSHNALANDGLPIALALLREEMPQSDLTPARCVVVSAESPVDLLVTDSAGHRLGRIGTSAFNEIADSFSDQVGETKAAVLHTPGVYAIRAVGTGTGDTTLRITWVDDGNVARQAVFLHVPTRTGSVATGTFDTLSGTVSDLAVDLHAAGRIDAMIPPYVLAGAAALDQEPPVLQILRPAAGQAVVGAVVPAWSAVDTGSGVAMTVGVLDGSRIDPGASLSPAAGSHELVVYAQDRAGNLARSTAAFEAYSFDWLEPAARSAKAGRTIPIRFGVHRSDGGFVRDTSVTVDLVDARGRTVVAPLVIGAQPSRAVTENGHEYHVDLDTTGVGPGAYSVRVRFSSASLVGEFGRDLSLR